MNWESRMQWLASGLCFAILLMIPSARAQDLPTQLNLVVLQGEGATNKIGQPTTSKLSVRVEDEKQNPITGCAVVFTLPTDGATGEFGNGSKTITTTTDNRGQAMAQGLKMNRFPGKVPIYINASYRGL